MIENTLLELALVMARLSLLSIGHAESILAQMEREVVGRGWLTQAEFAQAYALGQLTPGPGTVWVIPIGYQTAGLAGAVVALLAFFVPPAALAIAAVALWKRARVSAWPQAVRLALTPVAVGLTAAAVYALGRLAVRDLPSVLLLAATSLVLLRTRTPTPVVVLGTALAGALLLRP